MLPDLREIIAFWKVPRLCPFALLVKVTCRWRMEHWWSGTGRGKPKYLESNRSTRTKTYSTATRCTRNLTRTDLWSNPGLPTKRPTIGRPPGPWHGRISWELLWWLGNAVSLQTGRSALLRNVVLLVGEAVSHKRATVTASCFRSLTTGTMAQIICR